VIGIGARAHRGSLVVGPAVLLGAFFAQPPPEPASGTLPQSQYIAVLAISIVPFYTASRTCRPSTISPAADGCIWKRLSVLSQMRSAKCSHPPHSVSSDFQLAASRHLISADDCISGDDCATAGAAIGVGAAPRPPALAANLRPVTSVNVPSSCGSGRGIVAASFRFETLVPT